MTVPHHSPTSLTSSYPDMASLLPCPAHRYMDLQPRTQRAPLSSHDSFAAAKAEYQRKYEVYFAVSVVVRYGEAVGIAPSG